MGERTEKNQASRLDGCFEQNHRKHEDLGRWK